MSVRVASYIFELFKLGAARTYFKTKKSAHKRKLTGRQEANASLSRRRQRQHNVRVNLLLHA